VYKSAGNVEFHNTVRSTNSMQSMLPISSILSKLLLVVSANTITGHDEAAATLHVSSYWVVVSCQQSWRRLLFRWIGVNNILQNASRYFTTIPN